MRASLKKLGLAAIMALTVAGTAVVTAGSAQAQHWHGHGGGGFGAGFVGGLAAGAVIGGGPYYDGGYYGGHYAYGGGCYMVRRAYINQFGHRVIRRVRVCD